MNTRWEEYWSCCSLKTLSNLDYMHELGSMSNSRNLRFQGPSLKHKLSVFTKKQWKCVCVRQWFFKSVWRSSPKLSKFHAILCGTVKFLMDWQICYLSYRCLDNCISQKHWWTEPNLFLRLIARQVDRSWNVSHVKNEQCKL